MEKPFFPVPEPVPELILPGSVEYECKHNPFRYSSPNPGIPSAFGRPSSSSDKPGSRGGSRGGSREGGSRGQSRGKSRGGTAGLLGGSGPGLVAIDSGSDSDEEGHGNALELADKLKSDPDLVRESHSNKPLRLTKSIWTPVEGRLNIDTRSILRLGTGAGDIRNLGNITSDQQQRALESRLRVSENMKHYRKPFDGIEDVVRDGPVNSKAHRFWSARIDGVDYDEIPVNEFDESWDTLQIEVDAQSQNLDSVSIGGSIASVASACAAPTSTQDTSIAPLTKDSLDALIDHVPGAAQTGDSQPHQEHQHHKQHQPHQPPSTGRSRVSTETGASRRGHGHGRGHGSGRGHGPKGNRGKKAMGKAATDKAKQLTSDHPTQVPGTIKSSNSINWGAFEAAEMKKLQDTVLEMEKNKFRTHEIPLNKHGGGVFGATEEVRQLARMRVRMMRGMVAAIEDEEGREHARQKTEDEARKKKNRVKLKQLKDKHEHERHMHRTYIRTMRHDNEIVWSHRLQQNGYLW